MTLASSPHRSPAFLVRVGLITAVLCLTFPAHSQLEGLDQPIPAASGDPSQPLAPDPLGNSLPPVSPAPAASPPTPTPFTLQTTIPLTSAADRIDVYTSPEQQHQVALGLLEEQTVALIDVATGERLWQLPVGFAPTVVRIDPVRLLVYASGPNAPGLVTINLKTGALVQAYGLPAGVLDISFDAQMGRIFATMPAAQSIAVIHLDHPQARNLPMPGSPLALAFEPTNGNLLVTLAGEDPLSLLVVDPNNGELLARWRSGHTPEAIALDVERQRLIILNSGSQDLLVLDLWSNGERVQRIGLDWRPTRLALSPSGDQVYVTARDSDRLQVVDLISGQLQSTYAIGSQPTGIVSLPTATGPGLLIVEAGFPQLQWVEIPTTVVAQSAPPQPDLKGAVTGQVLDIAGQPVTQGTLVIAPTPEFPGRQAEIQPDGSYLIADLPAGVYLMDVQVPGFPPTSTQIQVRSHFVSTQAIQLPPAAPSAEVSGIGLLPDAPPFSDELARNLQPALAELENSRQVILLNGPLGPAQEFEQLADLTQNLTLLDRDERYTQDLTKLQLIGNALGLRYILLTQMQISREYNRQGSSLLNTAVRFLAPVVPIEIPNFTPNQLRSRGLVVVIDLHKNRPGDKAQYYEAYGRDDVGGDPMFEDAAAGLFRLQVRNMVPAFVQQWKTANPFGS